MYSKITPYGLFCVIMVISQLQPWASLLLCYSLLEDLVLHCMSSSSPLKNPSPLTLHRIAHTHQVDPSWKVLSQLLPGSHIIPHGNSPSYILPSTPNNLHPKLPLNREWQTHRGQADRSRVTFGCRCGWSPRDTRPCTHRCESRTSRTRWRPWRGLWSRTPWWHSASPRTCRCWGGRWAGTRPRSSSCGRPRTPCCCRAPCSSPGTRGGNTRFGLCRLASHTSWGTLQDTKQRSMSITCWGCGTKGKLCSMRLYGESFRAL